MRHRKANRQLRRTSEQRLALLRNLATSLIEQGAIETTEAKAKELRPFVEKLITTAKQKTLASRRQVTARLPDRKVFAWIADPNVPEARKSSEFWELPPAESIEFNRYGEVRKAPRLVEHLLTKVAPKFADRAGGYTRIVKLDKRRVGDGTDLVLLQLVGSESGSQISGRAGHRRKRADKRAAFAKKVKEAAAAKKVAA
jgi:large subunit ribosomal protein L17